MHTQTHTNTNTPVTAPRGACEEAGLKVCSVLEALSVGWSFFFSLSAYLYMRRKCSSGYRLRENSVTAFPGTGLYVPTVFLRASEPSIRFTRRMCLWPHESVTVLRLPVFFFLLSFRASLVCVLSVLQGVVERDLIPLAQHAPQKFGEKLKTLVQLIGVFCRLLRSSIKVKIIA